MSHANRPGDVLAGRYRLVDLLSESRGGRFWRAHDRVLERHVALHVIPEDHERAAALMEAARRSATVLDRRILRVLDADVTEGVCYVVNEWGWGASLDIVVAGNGALGPRRSAWLVSEVADSIATAHESGVSHGRLNPENVLIDRSGGVRIIGLCVDAALHGRPLDRPGTDVVDLAGLLYCLLTTKWAGRSTSQVPPAPVSHGEVLRPRRVRAGVPRSLDLLCDEVLHQHVAGRIDDVSSARGIADYLAEVVGDPTGMAEALRASTPDVLPDEELVVLPPVPELGVRTPPPARDPRPEPDPEPDPEPEPESGPAAGSATEPPIEELPTEAGLPIFGEDGDDVSWLEKRTTPAAPPPPFESPTPRPLFAPDPSDGTPLRRSRIAPTPPSARKDDGFWPFGSETGAGAMSRADGPHTGTGLDLTAVQDQVPGRNWFRLAAALSTALILVVVLLVAFNLGRGKTALGGDPADDSPTLEDRSSAPADVVRLTGLGAAAFDPQGDPAGVENNEDAALAVDGDPATAWSTEGYNDQLGPPPGLKTGVGLVIDLDGTHTVSDVGLQLDGSPTSVQLFVSDTSPTNLQGLQPVAEGTAEQEELTLTPDDAVEGAYLVVWLTSLPQDGDRFRGSINEVTVRGE